jgi:sugar-specific transcriptional regulator TrmB
MVYSILDKLLLAGLVEKKEEKGEVARFVPAHPTKIQDYAMILHSKSEKALQVASNIIPKIVSEYNLKNNKPGVRFFEGNLGMKAVLEDSLESRSEILTYADIEAIEKYIPEVNKEYVAMREKRGIKKRGIVLDTPFNRKFLEGYHEEVTTVKFIGQNSVPFETVMQIYDNKVSYLTLNKEQKIGVIIEDPHIYQMHKYLFEYLWDITKEETTQIDPHSPKSLS